MELNDAQIEALTRFMRVENVAASRPITARIHMAYLGLTPIELADILERGYVVMVDKGGVYSLTKAGRREIDKALNPPDERAQLIAQRTALETQLAAVNARLAALEPKTVQGDTSFENEAGVKRMIAQRFHEGE